MKFGILGINKASGMTSFDVIRSLKKKISISKIGHGGTLDPMADGVLPILINEGTAFFDALLNSSKKYYAIIQLGSSTDTDDKEGSIISQKPVPELSLEFIQQKISLLTGNIMQIPPQYSALKINGKRAYDLARAGQEVILEARPTSVYEWTDLSYDPKTQQISAIIHCGSGTYIRSLARDLAISLGTVGHLSFLRRTMSGGILLENTLSLENFPQNWEQYLISPENALSFLPALTWKGDIHHLNNGKPLSFSLIDETPSQEGLYRLIFHDKIIALVYFNGKTLSYRKNLAPIYKNNNQ